MIESHRGKTELFDAGRLRAREPSSRYEKTAVFLFGASETAAQIRSHDWTSTALGPIGTWPAALKAAASLILQSPVPMLVLWGDDGIMIYNDAYSALAGARHPTFIGTDARQAWPGLAEFNVHMMQVCLAGDTLQYRDREFSLQRNGEAERVWMNLDCSPILDENGTPAGVLAVVVETTERILVEQKNHNTLLDERTASELREQFIAILGHDLRNPLQAIFGAGDLLEHKLTEPSHVDIVVRIKTNVRRMSALIDDVLDFARGKLGGGIGVQVQDIADMDTALRSVVSELQDAQAGNHIVADISVTHVVRCDVARVQQVASNLLGNALTHGTAERAVRFDAVCDEDDLVLKVWNDGEPIPQESIGKIFEPFWRRSTAPHRKGLGLGLHICSQIVRAHGGTLSVVSTSETGTQFTARLPLRAPGERPR